MSFRMFLRVFIFESQFCSTRDAPVRHPLMWAKRCMPNLRFALAVGVIIAVMPLSVRADSITETFTLTVPSTTLIGFDRFPGTDFALFNPADGTLNDSGELIGFQSGVSGIQSENSLNRHRSGGKGLVVLQPQAKGRENLTEWPYPVPVVLPSGLPGSRS
jgi:hypothetical protein